MLVFVVITCPELTAPANGIVNITFAKSVPNEFGTRARYSCLAGHRLNGGNKTRVCEGDGSNPVGVWSGTSASCTGIIELQVVLNIF